MSEVTRILSAIEQGDPRAADQLLPLVYDELRRLAAQKLAQEKPGQTRECRPHCWVPPHFPCAAPATFTHAHVAPRGSACRFAMRSQLQKALRKAWFLIASTNIRPYDL
jgi:hypothetical protein